MTKRWLGAVFIMLGLASNAFSMQYTLETIEYPDSVWTRVSGINTKGDVVGAYNDGTKTHGYIYDGNSYTSVDFPGAAETRLRNINDSGKVVGWYNFDGEGFGFNETYGFLYDNVAYTSVAFPGGFGYEVPEETSINGINNNGTAVGGYWLGDVFGFSYDKGVIAQKFYGYGEDINDKGIIVAHNVEPGPWSWLVIDNNQVPFNGSENVSEINAYGINNLGHVVGELSGHEDFFTGNFIYDGEKFNLLDLPGTVHDINDLGQIVGNAEFAYIATPLKSTAVPEPSSMILLGLAIGGIFAAHRFSRGNTGSQLA